MNPGSRYRSLRKASNTEVKKQTMRAQVSKIQFLSLSYKNKPVEEVYTILIYMILGNNLDPGAQVLYHACVNSHLVVMIEFSAESEHAI